MLLIIIHSIQIVIIFFRIILKYERENDLLEIENKYRLTFQSARMSGVMGGIRLLQTITRRSSPLSRRYCSRPAPSKPVSSIPEEEPPSLSSFIFENLHKTSSLPALVNREEQLTYMEVMHSLEVWR